MYTLLSESPTLYYSFVFILSLLVGSFLNVVIYRLPIMMKNAWAREMAEQNNEEQAAPTTFNLVKPDSTCPKCGHKIRAWENIPLISWLFLRGKCSNCKTSISIRYPAVELLTALLSTLVAFELGFNIIAFGFIFCTWLLVAMTFIDLDEMLLPDVLTLSMLWIGLLIAAHSPDINANSAIVGGALGYAFLFLIYWGFKLLTGKEGMGFGDFKLLAAIGVWVGWQHLPIVILLSSVVGAVIGIALMLVNRKGTGYAIPFGPYLAIAGFITMLYGQHIADWYLSTL